MPKRQKQYHLQICRGLLLAGYLFLFAGQFNYRYFSIANFYVYNGGAVNTATVLNMAPLASAATSVHKVAPTQHPVALHDNRERPAHLGIDKRYQFMQGIRVPQIRAPGVAFAGIVRTSLSSFTVIYFATEPPTLSLRGPPCV